MKAKPALIFGGDIVFVKTHEDDDMATEILSKEKVIGIDCEWVPDWVPGRPPNPISIVQVCNGATCYIWLLFQYRGVPRGLHSLLINHQITKVGCGMRGSDLGKLGISKMPVGPAIEKKDKSGTTKLYYELPEHFEDVQDYVFGDDEDEKPPYSGLEHLMAFILDRRSPSTLQSVKVKWHLIERRSDIQLYAVTDAYAVYCMHLMYHGETERVNELEARDNDAVRHLVKQYVGETPFRLQGGEELAALIRNQVSLVPPFELLDCAEISEELQHLDYLQRLYFAARIAIEAYEQKISKERYAASQQQPRYFSAPIAQQTFQAAHPKPRNPTTTAESKNVRLSAATSAPSSSNSPRDTQNGMRKNSGANHHHQMGPQRNATRQPAQQKNGYNPSAPRPPRTHPNHHNYGNNNGNNHSNVNFNHNRNNGGQQNQIKPKAHQSKPKSHEGASRADTRGTKSPNMEPTRNHKVGKAVSKQTEEDTLTTGEGVGVALGILGAIGLVAGSYAIYKACTEEEE